jgi:hypothetical protein
MKKPKRNDPCPCGSGKKFKKCCESKMIGKKFMATKIDSTLKKQNKVFSLFKNKVDKSKSEDKKENKEEKDKDKNS